MTDNGRQCHPGKEPGKRLGPAAQDKLVLILLDGAGPEQAARRMKCSPRTVYRYLGDAAFRRRLTEERERLFRQATDLLVANVLSAGKRLVELVADDDKELSLKAVGLALGHAARYRELADFGARLAAIEARLPPQIR
jgi:hypothetical protein